MYFFKKNSILLIIVAIFISTFSSLSYLHKPSQRDQSKENNTRESEFFYWLALSDFGNINFIDLGINLIHQNKNGKNLKQTEEQTTHLTDLLEQRDMAHDTMAGIFPLYRFLYKNILFSPDKLSPYEIIDDIEVIAATNAINDQIHTLLDNWKSVPHFDVIFSSNPANTSLENEALYLFNQHSKFFVHNLRDKQIFLNKYGLTEDDLALSPLEGEVMEALKRHFGASHFIIVSISQQLSPKQGAFYVATSKVLDLYAGKALTIRNMGFAIDSKPDFAISILITSISLLGGFAILLSIGISTQGKKDIFIAVGLYITFFLAMLILISSGGALISNLIYTPSMEVLAISGWWIIPITVLVSMIFPALIIITIADRMKLLLVLRYVEVSEIALLATIQAMFCWVTFLYIVYASASADPLTISLLIAIPFLLFNFWRNKGIGINFFNTSILAAQIFPILTLTISANSIWILSGASFALLAHFADKKILVQFWRRPIKKLVMQEAVSEGAVISLVSEGLSKLFRNDQSPDVVIILSDDIIYSNYVGDQLRELLSCQGYIVDIEAADCMTDYSLVSKIVGRHVVTASDNFDTALDIASDFIPFGSLIAAKAGTSDVKDRHIQECGYTHFRAQIDQFQCSYLFIRNLSVADEASIIWLNGLLEKPWANKLKICITTSCKKIVNRFDVGKTHTHFLNQMDESQALTFLNQYPLMTKSICELILKELSNVTNKFFMQDLRQFEQLASQIVNSDSQISESDLLAKIQEEFSNSADDEQLNIIIEICNNHLHKKLLAVTSYVGPEIDLIQLSFILEVELTVILKLIDEINRKHWVFIDTASVRLVAVFRSGSFHKTCFQYFQFHKSVDMQTSFSQVMAARCVKAILKGREISIERRHELLTYLCAVESSNGEWLLDEVLRTCKQHLLNNRPIQSDGFLQMANMLVAKFKSTMPSNECRHTERELELVNLLNFIIFNKEDVYQRGAKVERFFHRWGVLVEEDADIIYLQLRSLYDARFELETATFTLQIVSDKLLVGNGNFPAWLTAELIHYQHLAKKHLSAENFSASENWLLCNDLRAALEILETETDSPSELAAYSRIVTTLISMDPFDEEIYRLAEQSIHIKERLFDAEGVAMTMGAIARASFFAGEQHFQNGNALEAKNYFENFLVKAVEWRRASEETTAPLAVMIMIDNLKAQSYVYLGRIDGNNEDIIGCAFELISGIMKMKITPDTKNVSVFRQLVSTHSILLELQLFDSRFTNEFSFDDTKSFYQRFKSSIEPYLLRKFELMIQSHELDWDK